MDEPMTGSWVRDLAAVLAQTLSTSAEQDRGGAYANVVDGLFAIARAGDGIAAALSRIAAAVEREEARDEQRIGVHDE